MRAKEVEFTAGRYQEDPKATHGLDVATGVITERLALCMGYKVVKAYYFLLSTHRTGGLGKQGNYAPRSSPSIKGVARPKERTIDAGGYKNTDNTLHARQP